MFTQTVKLRGKIYRVYAKMGNVFQKRFPQGLPSKDSIYSIEFVTMQEIYTRILYWLTYARNNKNEKRNQ